MLAVFALVVVSACLHVGWNLIARHKRDSPALLHRIPLVVGLVGLVPALVAERFDPMLSRSLLGFLALTGAVQAIYYVALARAYASSELAHVYPLSRALPMLLLVMFDRARGRGFSAIGLAGMALIVVGCVLAPLAARRGFAVRRLVGPTAAWIALIVLATVGFSVVDKLALESLAPRPGIAARYGVWEAIATVPFLRALTARARAARGSRGEDARAEWRWTLLAAAFSFGSYGLVLWAYQLSTHTSHVAAIRQVSIPLGVVASRVVLGEKATGLHVAAAMMISVGMACMLAAG